jgi:ABC-type antimicrobial peptide transport system permease subunit
VVDRAYAERASSSTLVDAGWQVWLAKPSQAGGFATKLRHAGVAVAGTQTSAGLAGRYSRQGPALALVLFLADAAAAALLAAAGAVLALHLAGRRRTYELAALSATGARRRSLRGGLLIEQGLTLGFGALVGIGAGILAAYLSVPSVPEFVHSPKAPALHYTPNAGALAALLGIAVVLLAVAAVASVTSLVRAARPDQLREAPA